ncbi:TM2 domain-containing protein [Lentisphaera profundi]|uniref:TM2 domain-containing protein n=1 Tax=Lentisphaera profundi TaxID=1658616 RepID=A0ABY7W0U8_9BACT|nr:TM2 domain-containing protein [Lentisphaera profundi]WDE99098.1 TM2 domain-containing protein [Lentisphaera profundi]
MENENKSSKSKVIAALLAFFFGALGVHNFYLGHTKNGIIQLVLSLLVVTAIISWVWAVVDFIKILTDKLDDSQGLALA